MDWGVNDKGGLIQGCKACCKPQESERRRDKQEKVGTGLGELQSATCETVSAPGCFEAMNSRFCRRGFLRAVSSVAGGFVVSLISRYLLGVGSLIDTVEAEREGTWRSGIEREHGWSKAKAIGPSASCSRTLARRTDHAQLLGSIQMVRAKTAFNPEGRQLEKGGHPLSNQSHSQIFHQDQGANPQQGFPWRCITSYKMRARELRRYARRTRRKNEKERMKEQE